eukprot:Anaeramoba_ignava/c16393_g1_i2.p2 GENE.c16393_g1_i2~~c16393_g1_i2.p2  ORF type:complete len:202 (-),score=8.39 c16393_g1_i2:316-921(-)
MKKIQTLLIALLLAGGIMAQPVVDNAIIPVSVTLNSILRLNVTSGSNIEFAVNTLNQYTNGIANSDQHDTDFTVASSVDFIVELYAEDATLIGSDLASGANTMPLDNIGYTLEITGTGTEPANWDLVPDAGVAVAVPLTNTPDTIINSTNGAGAGDIGQNAFKIEWECGTGNGTMNATSLLNQDLPSDRYSTNVFLVLQPK